MINNKMISLAVWLQFKQNGPIRFIQLFNLVFDVSQLTGKIDSTGKSVPFK